MQRKVLEDVYSVHSLSVRYPPPYVFEMATTKAKFNALQFFYCLMKLTSKFQKKKLASHVWFAKFLTPSDRKEFERVGRKRREKKSPSMNGLGESHDKILSNKRFNRDYFLVPPSSLDYRKSYDCTLKRASSQFHLDAINSPSLTL